MTTRTRNPDTGAGSALNAPPEVADDEGGSRFIGGFPGTYTPSPRHVPGFTGPVSANQAENTPMPTRLVEGVSLDALRASGRGGYQIGDEWEPVNYPEAAVRDLQRRLYQAGLITPDDIIEPGYYDETTKSAFRRLLERANGMGLDWDTTLEDLRSNPVPYHETEPQLPAPSVSNPTDLRKAFKDVARRVWGTGNISEADLQRMIDSFQGVQADAQVQQQLAAMNNTGATTVGAPSVEAFAEEELAEADPMRVDGRKVISGLTEVFDMFGDGQ